MWNHWQYNCIACITLAALVLVLFILRGLRGVDRETVRAARTLGMTRRAIWWHVILAQARGWILAGVLAGAVAGAAAYGFLLYYGGR